ncbi:Cro/C1-type helix-turn-helix DNA-binding protein [Ruminiclostridium sufflavum DSM 19573]|uniref:Cro/C1-type helix-turn-helix DNA-binding protein n=1 Tax=Ruminiclostridium sufflavum DSM 19573 TaxID=1121337 RepID=A0A318XPA7_9FIRM|nr:helix-turn-helix domain-containing protein [Ruminiclostridium sufflavum]PYG90166.1 Cro/C1-type helix-turn-helix DNA-binding protein [Ruminiclostridium sufflavum DSM 19573]
MTNTIELEIAIKRAGFTKRELAKKLGLSEMGLYKKINNITEFKASEISTLCEVLSIENKDEIFFAQKVEFNSTKNQQAACREVS